MHEGINFQNSYVPFGHIDSLRMIMHIAASKHLCCNMLDISNAFQNSIIFDPWEHVYLTLPPWYLEWFHCKWPDFKLALTDIKLLVLQCLKSIQCTKQAGNQWHWLLSEFFSKWVWFTVLLIMVFSFGIIKTRTAISIRNWWHLYGFMWSIYLLIWKLN